jgi:hypothetical protein
MNPEVRMLRFSVVTLFLGALALSSAAEARAGRSFGGLGRSSAVPRQIKSVLPGEAARAVPARGRLNVVVPVPIRRGEPPPAFDNAAASAAAAQPLGLAAPARPVRAGGPALFEPSAAPRPWCENGNVVGGLCLLN